MPVDGSSTEILNSQNAAKKKRSNKKRRQQQQQRKYQSKTRLLDGNDANGSNGIKNNLNLNRCDVNKLTPGNVASLRWDNILTDPILENERIERYKELRRQRYIDARQHTVQSLLEQMQMTTAKDSTNATGNEQQ